MSVGVVDLLQLVDVEEGHRQGRLVALGARDLFLEAVVEVAVVVDSGERIGVGGALQPFVQLRDLDLSRDLRAHGLHEGQVPLAEGGHGGMAEHENAHGLPARDERHDELAPHPWVADVTRVGADVVDDLALAVCEDPTGDAPVARNAGWRIDGGPRAGDGTRHELVGLLVVQQDGERGPRDRAHEHDERAVEQLLQVEDGVELGRELGQDGKLAAR